MHFIYSYVMRLSHHLFLPFLPITSSSSPPLPLPPHTSSLQGCAHSCQRWVFATTSGPLWPLGGGGQGQTNQPAGFGVFKHWHLWCIFLLSAPKSGTFRPSFWCCVRKWTFQEEGVVPGHGLSWSLRVSRDEATPWLRKEEEKKQTANILNPPPLPGLHLTLIRWLRPYNHPC